MHLFGSSVFPIRPECPDCAMNMIVAKGLDFDRGGQTFECLRCGHIEKPKEGAGTPQSKEAALNWPLHLELRRAAG